QTYGAMAAGGGAIARPFSFTAVGACGDVILPLLQLQDGNLNLGTVNFAIQLGPFSNLLAQSFDAVTAPALPAGWTTTASGAESLWITSTNFEDSIPNCAFSPDPGSVGVNELVSPAVILPNAPVQLSFRNHYDLEAGTGTKAYDGAVLEIKIGTGSFTDILAAGGTFLSGGYSHVISSAYSNPLAGRQAWSSSSGGFITTLVSLPAAAAGQTVQLRWRCGSDSSVSGNGWDVDSISVYSRVCCQNSSGNGAALLSPRITNGILTFILSGNAGGNYEIQ